MIKFLQQLRGLWLFPLFPLCPPFSVSTPEACATRGIPGTGSWLPSLYTGLLLLRFHAAPTVTQVRATAPWCYFAACDVPKLCCQLHWINRRFFSWTEIHSILWIVLFLKVLQYFSKKWALWSIHPYLTLPPRVWMWPHRELEQIWVKNTIWSWEYDFLFKERHRYCEHWHA